MSIIILSGFGSFTLWALAIIGVIALLRFYGRYIYQSARQKTLNQIKNQDQEIENKIFKFEQNKHLLTHHKLTTIFFETYKDKFGAKRFAEVNSEFRDRLSIQEKLAQLKETPTFPIDFRDFTYIADDCFSDSEDECLLALLIFSDWSFFAKYETVKRVKERIVQDIIQHYDPEEPISVFNMYYIRVQKLLEIH